MTDEERNRVTHRIIGCAMKVHSVLGPGLLESAYEACLEYELVKFDLPVRRQLYVPVEYDGVELDCGYRIDLLVAEEIVVELKSVALLAPVHVAQVLTYLRLAGLSLGLLINFNVAHLREGIKRVIHSPPSAPSAPLR